VARETREKPRKRSLDESSPFHPIAFQYLTIMCGLVSNPFSFAFFSVFRGPSSIRKKKAARFPERPALSTPHSEFRTPHLATLQ
jgi:hypothetical protein